MSRRLSRSHTFRRTASVGALVLFTSVLVPALPGGTSHADPPAAPAAGALDASFGGDGWAAVPTGGDPGLVVLSRVVANDDSGVRVVTTNEDNVHAIGGMTGAGADDPALGESGFADLPTSFIPSTGHTVVRDTRDGIYVGGQTDGVLAVVRLLAATGAVDTSWADGGVYVGSLGAPATALAWHADRLFVGVDDGEGGAVVLALTANGDSPAAPDATWGDGGTAFLPFTTEISYDGPLSVDVDSDGRVYVLLQRYVGEPFHSFVAVVARLTSDGLLETESYGGAVGYVEHSLETGDSGGVADLVVDPDGAAWVIASNGDAEGLVLRLDDTGQLQEDAGDLGHISIRFEGGPTSLAAGDLDSQGRLVVVGTGAYFYQAQETTLPTGGVARLTRTGSLDGSFGALSSDDVPQGSELLPCPVFEGPAQAGTLDAVTHDADGRIVTAGSCGGVPIAIRILGTGALGDLVLTADASTVHAAPSTVPVADIPPDALDTALGQLAASPLRYSPLRYSPLRYSPLRYSPLRYSPLRYSPLRYSPVGGEELAEITLAQVPLAPPDDWDVILRDTPYEEVPLQAVYVHELLEYAEGLPETDGKRLQIDALKLEAIDLAATSLRDSSLAAFLLGETRIAELPAPSIGWCSYLAGSLVECPPTSDTPPDVTLLTLELAGVDLTGWLTQALPITGRPFAEDTPLRTLVISDNLAIDLSRTATGDLTGLDVGHVCAGSCAPDATLSELQAGGALAADATLGDLLSGLPIDLPQGPAGAGSIGDLLRGMIADEEIPWEGLELDTILDRTPIAPATPTTTYTATFTADCADLDGLAMAIVLPHGARYVPESAELVVEVAETREPLHIDVTVIPSGTGGPEAEIPRDAGRPTVVAESTEGLECTGPSQGAYTLDAVAPRRLGPTTANAVVALPNGGGSVRVTNQAPVDVTDPHDANAPAPAGEPTTRALTENALELGYLGRAGAADYYALPVTAGETVTFTLSHLPSSADFDLIVYDDLPVDANGLPAAIPNTPLRYSPLRYSPLRYSPTDDAEASTEPTVAVPEDLQGVPLLSKRIRGASAARGQQVEAVRVDVRDGEPARLIAAVVPFNGAQAATPYVLHTQVNDGPELAPCLLERTFAAAAPTLTGRSLTSASVTSSTESLILVDRARMTRLYGSGVEEQDGLWKDLLDFAASDKVNGVVVDVGADVDVDAAMALMDADPCSVPKINDVVSRINELVDDLRGPATGLRFITLIGNDDALPMGRIPDLTEIANQRDYAPNARVGLKDNAVSRSFATKYLLSDDPYGALAPSAYLDTQLFVPDLAVGRLVEMPAEISSSLEEFADKQGVRTLDGAFVASYDFLTDLGGALVGSAAASRGEVTAYNPGVDDEPATDDPWTREDATLAMAEHAHGVLAVNGHYDNNRALPADEDAKGTHEELLIAAQDLPADMSGGVLVTVGCNAGLNLSDLLLETVSGQESHEDYPRWASRTEDWAQRVSAANGVLVANTGFGYGDDVAIAYSEKLVQYFGENLDGTMTLGQALQFAKQRFLNGVAGVYDHKALQEATYYGIPQWRVGLGGGVANTVLPTADAPPATPVLALTSRLFSPSYDTLRVTSRGSWYPIVGQLPQLTAYRPVQPRLDESLVADQPTGLVAHGAVLESLTTIDRSIDDPAVSVPITDLAAAQPEPPTTEAFFPSTLQQVVSRTTPDGREDALVLVAGQFRSGEGTDPDVQRLVEKTDVRTTWSDSADFRPPQVTDVDGVIDSAKSQVAFFVKAPDADTSRVSVLYLPELQQFGDPAPWSRLELTETSEGLWTGAQGVTDWHQTLGQFFVQAVDSAGNVTVNSNKGFNYRAAPLADNDMFELALEVDPDETGATVTVVAPAAAQESAPAYTYTINGGTSLPYPDGGIRVEGHGTHLVRVADVMGNVAEVLVVLQPVPALSLSLHDPGQLQVTDPAQLSARVTDQASGFPVPGIEVTFTLGTQGATGTSGPDGVARATVAQVVGPAAAAQELTVVTTATTDYPSVSDGPLSVVVVAEDTEVTYTGDLLRSTGAPDATTGVLRLKARVVQEADGSLGDLARAGVTFHLDDGGVQRQVVTPTSGLVVDNGVLTATVDSAALPAGTYVIRPVVTGGWFAGEGEDVIVTLYTPSTEQFVTGGGHVNAFLGTTTAPAAASAAEPKGHFGLHAYFVKVIKGGRKGTTTTLEPRGSAAYAFRDESGLRWTFTTRTISQIAFGGGTTTGSGKNKTPATTPPTAAITGEVTVWRTPEGGDKQRVPGKFTWRMDVTDKTDGDTFAVTVYDANGKVYLQTGTATAQVPLTGGNTVVHK